MIKLDDIGQLTDENELKDIRDMAAARLEQIREEKAVSSKQELDKKYKDKYLLFYGKQLTMSGPSEPDKNHLKIVHVIDCNFRGRDFIRVQAKVIEIQYDSEPTSLMKLGCTGFGECHTEFYEDFNYDFHENQIVKIIDKNEVNEMVKKAVDYNNYMMAEWDV